MKIVASNELDEYADPVDPQRGGADRHLRRRHPAGHLRRAKGAAPSAGSTSWCASTEQPRLKVTSDIAKATLPDRKRLLRAVRADGRFVMDILCLQEEAPPRPGELVYDPTNPARHKSLPAGVRLEELRRTVMEKGRILAPAPSLEQMADHCADQLQRLPEGSLRLANPHRYKVSMSRNLHELRSRLMENIEKRY